jgi:flagellar hook-basal body complex protein FliE
LKEKLNYRHFLELDLSTQDLQRAKGSFASWLEDQQKNLQKKQEEGREQSECGAVAREEQGMRDTVCTFATSTSTSGDTTTASTIGGMDGDGTGDGDVGSGQIIISTATTTTTATATTPKTSVYGASTEDVLASLLRDMTADEVQIELKQWHRTVWTAATCCQTTAIHEIASHLNTL